MVQTLARCRYCGLPGKVAENMVWYPNGTIVLRRSKGLRVAILDIETMRDIHAALEAEMGADALWVTVRNATRFITGKSLAGLKGKLSRYGVIKKRVLEAIEDHSLLLGMGRIEVEKFTPAMGGAMLLRRPFDIEIATAGITGVLEEVDHCPYKYGLSEGGEDSYRLLLELAEVDDYDAQSLRGIPFFMRATTGGEKAAVCNQCGLPSSVAELQWDELYGTVDAGAGGRRVAFIPGYIISALTHHKSASDEGRCRRLVEEAVYVSARRSFEGGPADAYEGERLLPREGSSSAAWERLRVRGWGAVVEESIAEEGWRVTVLNPVDKALIAGWLRALYTVTVGREAQVEVREEPPVSFFEMG